ncbi:hypothetical protein SAMN05428997_14514 [Bosea sp. CRIB-10]|uniref:DUF6615 family protein n=1 Tax=Bosea sp. CRIB-10 TaxID=378404 RepID=UPI0008E33A16|nr:hypothetical protein SAMN05428997_14514 [Bosea sp. CRIB-10]
MLCELAHSFPPRVAELLERDRSLTRNFREESITDVLMASLVGLEPFGIRVDFPDEPTTGGDMEWIFAAPLELNSGSYLRLVLQAKRAHFTKLKAGGYWYYHHLDYGTPKGDQAQTLVNAAGTAFPIYIFYNPTSALAAKTATLPAVEGINLVFAHHVALVVRGGCGKKAKKIDAWRKHFMPLSDILCWPTTFVAAAPNVPPDDATLFAINGDAFTLPKMTGAFHPDIIAERLNRKLDIAPVQDSSGVDRVAARPTNQIPLDIRRAIAGEVSAKDRRELRRPRVILSTQMKRSDPDFAQLQELSRR